MLPVRCFTCGKPITRYAAYEEQTKTTNASLVLDNLGISKICCRRMYLSHDPTFIDKLLLYETQPRFHNTSKTTF